MSGKWSWRTSLDRRPPDSPRSGTFTLSTRCTSIRRPAKSLSPTAKGTGRRRGPIVKRRCRVRKASHRHPISLHDRDLSDLRKCIRESSRQLSPDSFGFAVSGAGRNGLRGLLSQRMLAEHARADVANQRPGLILGHINPPLERHGRGQDRIPPTHMLARSEA
jgi:hypothetical protein